METLLERIRTLDVDQILTAPIVVSPSTPVSKIIGELKETNDYEVFIEDKDKIGMLTLRNILRASNITQVKAETLAVNVPRLTLRTSVDEAARLMMEYRIRALPVVKGQEIVGRVTTFAIINLLHEVNALTFRAADIMTRHPISLDANALASKARQLMVRRQIDHLPVLSSKGVDGVLTSAHIVFNMFQATETIGRSTIFSEEQKRLEIPIRHIMDSSPLTCDPSDKLSVIFNEMQRLGSTYSLVTLWEEVQGIITYRDFMKLITARFEPDTTQIYIVGLPDDPFEAEMARSKFQRTVEFLKKSLPYIEEAKSTIRAYPASGKTRKRYEVKVSIVTPKRVFTYSDKGWELSTIYDTLASKLRKIMERQKRRQKRPGFQDSGIDSRIIIPQRSDVETLTVVKVTV